MTDNTFAVHNTAHYPRVGKRSKARACQAGAPLQRPAAAHRSGPRWHRLGAAAGVRRGPARPPEAPQTRCRRAVHHKGWRVASACACGHRSQRVCRGTTSAAMTRSSAGAPATPAKRCGGLRAPRRPICLCYSDIFVPPCTLLPVQRRVGPTGARVGSQQLQRKGGCRDRRL